MFNRSLTYATSWLDSCSYEKAPSAAGELHHSSDWLLSSPVQWMKHRLHVLWVRSSDLMEHSQHEQWILNLFFKTFFFPLRNYNNPQTTVNPNLNRRESFICGDTVVLDQTRTAVGGEGLHIRQLHGDRVTSCFRRHKDGITFSERSSSVCADQQFSLTLTGTAHL